MIASERLRELYELPVLEKYETNLFQYLPQISEVVKQAEQYANAALHWSEDAPRQQRMRLALTALCDSLEKP